MPITKDLRAADGFQFNDASSDDMVEAEMEFSDIEKTMAQKTIRRSVVREKLNWSS